MADAMAKEVSISQTGQREEGVELEAAEASVVGGVGQDAAEWRARAEMEETCPLGENEKRELLRMEESTEGWICVKNSETCHVYMKEGLSGPGRLVVDSPSAAARRSSMADHAVGQQEKIKPTASATNSQSSVQILKAYLKLPGIRYFQALDYLAKLDARHQWDGIFHGPQILEEQDDYTISHCGVRVPPSFEKRDLVLASKLDLDLEGAGRVMMMWQSCDHQLAPPPTSLDTIRARAHLSGIIIRPDGKDDGKSTRLTMILQLDMGSCMADSDARRIVVEYPMDWQIEIMNYHQTTLKELKEFYSAKLERQHSQASDH